MGNEGQEIDIVEALQSIWSKRKRIILWGIVGILAGVIISFSIPKEYVSVVRVVPENSRQNNTMNSLGGIAAMMGMSVPGTANDGIGESVYPAILTSSPFISEFRDIQVNYNDQRIKLIDYLTKRQKRAWWSYILNAPSMFIGLFSNDSSDIPQVINDKNPTPLQWSFERQFAKRILAVKEKKTGIYDISVKMQDPEIATVVADSVITKLERYMTTYYTSKTKIDLESNMEMLDKARREYYKADAEHALAVDKNKNLISKIAQIKIDRLENEKDLTFAIYKQLASQVEMNKIKLQSETPIITVIEPARVPDRKASPNKNLVIMGCLLLAIFASSAKVLFDKYFLKKED